MLNQVSVEALYSATYVENYLDCVENLPDELQRLISRMRELDVYYLARVRELENQTQIWKNAGSENSSKKTRAAMRMQQALIAAQELGDEKMSILQSIHEKIEMKTRLLDQDFKNLDFGKDETSSADNKEQQPPLNNTSSSTSLSNTERPTKRARRTRQDTFSGLESNHNSNSVDHVLRSQVTNNTTTQKKSNTGTGKKKKRKSRQTNQSAQREESPPREEEAAIDPDEPTYCLCDQISFGEMIMCDNDLCPIEWFHFSCVTLTTKPKGKWYCPKCRGDRPNVMKPKAQFLRELEKYNKEKEEKT
ncbi:inhibitor of growth protein [Holotrichia oblita]|uniref:Inhibitor of growth protein n=2 Tax=Holotrichia oblita TaxID=644536 RepID=A0ACB9T9K7_HOLOL|nr:inhibitor of growth protein [Holotrichia oblita]KAI4463498.1 inhibitor of growth protein [Holotrichia oblita]